jgi:hypothetical protein
MQNILNGVHGCSLWVLIDKIQNCSAVLWVYDVYVEILINMKKNNTKLPSGGRYVQYILTETGGVNKISDVVIVVCGVS